MTVKALIAAQDLSVSKKGEIAALITEGGGWGNKEDLPNYIRLIVTDATRPQAKAYLEKWTKIFTYTILQENPQWYRIRVEVDPIAIAIGGNGAEVKQELKDYILSGVELDWEVTQLAQTSTSIDVQVTKPADLQQGKVNMMDRFEETIAHKRYYFASATVDAAITEALANEPTHEVYRTKAQINPLLLDRLAE